MQYEIDLSGYTLSLPLDSQSVSYTSILSVPSDELLSLTLNDSIAIDVLIDTLWFGSVTGVVDSVDISIDTVKKQISALPDEMDGFDFTNVEILINFESEITIPVFLDLTFICSFISSNLGITSCCFLYSCKNLYNFNCFFVNIFTF